MLLDAYLDHIGYKGPRAPTAETLHTLHRQHMLTVPFENLDISFGRKIVLDPERFFDKIVGSGRGGFCYELNGAFASLLTALGFRVDMLSARVVNEQGTLSEEFDHLALRVEAEGTWLADVGFGDNFLGPLRFTSGVEQKDSVADFRLTEIGGRWQLERRQTDGSWRLVYDLSPQPRNLGEFADRCHYHQTSSSSHFTRNRICSLAKPHGRITLSDIRLISNSSGIRQEQVLASEEDWRAALRDHFGVVLG